MAEDHFELGIFIEQAAARQTFGILCDVLGQIIVRSPRGNCRKAFRYPFIPKNCLLVCSAEG